MVKSYNLSLKFQSRDFIVMLNYVCVKSQYPKCKCKCKKAQKEVQINRLHFLERNGVECEINAVKKSDLNLEFYNVAKLLIAEVF